MNTKIKQLNTIKDYITTNKLISLGFNNKDIKNFHENNKLIKLKKGLYRKFNTNIKEQSFVDVSVAMPKSVVCLLSALSYYHLTTFIPKKVTIAMPRGIRKPKFIEPGIQVFYMSNNFYEMNIKTIKEGKYKFNIYDIEKTICDCFKYRNKIGIDILKESFKEYLKLKNRNIPKLLEIAAKLKVEKIVLSWLTATM